MFLLGLMAPPTKGSKQLSLTKKEKIPSLYDDLVLDHQREPKRNQDIPLTTIYRIVHQIQERRSAARTKLNSAEE